MDEEDWSIETEKRSTYKPMKNNMRHISKDEKIVSWVLVIVVILGLYLMLK